MCYLLSTFVITYLVRGRGHRRMLLPQASIAAFSSPLSTRCTLHTCCMSGRRVDALSIFSSPPQPSYLNLYFLSGCGYDSRQGTEYAAVPTCRRAIRPRSADATCSPFLQHISYGATHPNTQANAAETALSRIRKPLKLRCALRAACTRAPPAQSNPVPDLFDVR